MAYVISDYIRRGLSMITDLLLAIAHHLLAFSLIAFLVAELVLLTASPARPVLRSLLFIDLAYGAAAAGSIMAGVSRLHWGDKPAEFYTHNPVFWVKMGLWVLVGLISVVPTIRYITWIRRQELPSPAVFASTRRLVAFEVATFTGIPVFAAMMARGIGY
jgi:putative membrane protein